MATKKKEPEPPKMTEEQIKVAKALIDEGIRQERERIINALVPFEGQEKFLDVDRFLLALRELE